ncbi:hypothetical protein D3C77_548920 [compost metagenome]
MKSKKNMPYSAVLNSKWQMVVRKYGSNIVGFLLGLMVFERGGSSIVLQGATVMGCAVTLLGVGALIFHIAMFLVLRKSGHNYDLDEWTRAVREQFGQEAIIVLNPNGRISIHSGGQTIEFESAESLVRGALVTA